MPSVNLTASETAVYAALWRQAADVNGQLDAGEVCCALECFQTPSCFPFVLCHSARACTRVCVVVHVSGSVLLCKHLGLCCCDWCVCVCLSVLVHFHERARVCICVCVLLAYMHVSICLCKRAPAYRHTLSHVYTSVCVCSSTTGGDAAA